MSHTKAKRAAQQRQAATGEPYARARRIASSQAADAEKASPAPIVHAFPGVDDDVVCGHYAQHADDRVSLDWDEVTCGDCHQARAERGRLADEVAEAHAELARQFAADTGTREQPEQAFLAGAGRGPLSTLVDYGYAARIAGQLADVRRRYLAEREHNAAGQCRQPSPATRRVQQRLTAPRARAGRPGRPLRRA